MCQETCTLYPFRAWRYAAGVMSDHAIIAALAVVGFTIQISGLIVLARMLRESQRLTRAVAGLVYQENERTRSLLGRP